MCGITGFWQKNSDFSTEELLALTEKMSDQIDHRGPDSFGIWCDEKNGIGFGHRRLSIIDLSSAGHQPMKGQESGLVLSYNGEIYNTLELRNELIKLGQTFIGYSDTEVILKACETWGIEKTCQRLLGMFAFSLWDEKNKNLYLVRDRLGKKPLYWGVNNGVLFFGSQIKSFKPHPSWKPELDKNVLATYFRFNYVPAPVTIFKNLYKLKPGTILKLDKEWNQQEIIFWDFQEVIRQGKQNILLSSDKEIIDEAEILLKDAVKRRMVADVPLGAFLSGGIDSSTVVALMQAQSEKPIKTFTIGYKEQNFNEAEYAKKIAQHLHTEHHELYLEPKETIEVIQKIPSWFDEPFADASQIPTFLVSNLARRHVTVALSGDGGDEIFAGYMRYFVGQRLWTITQAVPPWFKHSIANLIHSLKPKTWDMFSRALPRKIRPNCFADRMYKMANVLKIDNAENFYKSLVSQWHEPNQLVHQAKELILFPWQNLGENNNLNLDDTLQDEKNFNIVEYMQMMDVLTYLPDDVLAKVDRASMAISLETRVPLLDHRVVEFAWRLPLDKKIRHNKGKWLLREVLTRYIPKDLIERPKMGFGVPIDQWLRSSLRPWAESLIFDSNLKHEGLLNTNLIEKIWKEHKSGARNWQNALWGVLMFLAWKQHFKL